MNKFFKKVFGVDQLEAATKAAMEKLAEVERKAALVEEYAKTEQMSPKQRATEAKVPWVDVVKLIVDKENPRYGYFELDWNEYHVEDLKAKGYTGSTNEEIVDQWFTGLCRAVGNDEGIDMSRRSSGYINVSNLGNGKTEVY